jgi:hypothetical protein
MDYSVEGKSQQAKIENGVIRSEACEAGQKAAMFTWKQSSEASDTLEDSIYRRFLKRRILTTDPRYINGYKSSKTCIIFRYRSLKK